MELLTWVQYGLTVSNPWDIRSKEYVRLTRSFHAVSMAAVLLCGSVK